MHVFARQSLDATRIEPSALLASSTDAGWRSALLRIYRSNGACDPFETVLTPDQTVVVHLSGNSELKSFAGGRWHTGVTQPGSVGLTPANHRSRLRWRALDPDGYVSAHLHLPHGFLAEAADHYARPRSSQAMRHLNALSVGDRQVDTIVRALSDGLRQQESEVFLETALQALARALLDPGRSWDESHRACEPVDDRQIRRAIEYMTCDLAAPINLTMIAREAAVSKFHFVRRFREKVGVPPHTFLTRVRLGTAYRMLRTSDLPVATIAALVGYGTARNFSTAFVRRFGVTPRAVRHEEPAGP